MTFRLIPSALAILWALTAKAPKPLRVYFFAQLFNTLLVEFAYEHVGRYSYAALYTIGLLIIVCAMVDIVWTSVKSWGIIALALSFAGIMSAAVFFSIQHLDVGSMAGLVEGGILTACGTALSFRVPYATRWKIPAALVMLWLTLAFFDFSYALSVSGTEVLNLWFRTFALIAAMVYLGWKLREPSQAQGQGLEPHPHT